MHLLDLPIEVLQLIFLQLDLFKTAKYRRVCRSFNNVLTVHPFSNLIGLVHIGHIPITARAFSDFFCFVTPASFGKDFLTGIQTELLKHHDGLETRNDFAVIPLKSSNAASLLECFPSEFSRRSEPLHLVGPLPTTIGCLKQLTALELEGHKLSGPIPRSLGDLTRLTNLNLKGNRVTGPSNLNLKGNRVTGPILAELCNLVNLRNLNLARTDLDEAIPDSIGNLVNLEVLDMSYARLTGSIPASIGNLVNLVELNLRCNWLTGLPDAFGAMTKLQMLSLEGNGFTGSIPASLGRCMQLTTFLARRNSFTGSVHESIFRLPLLRHLRLDMNSLTWESSPTSYVRAQPIRMETIQLASGVNPDSDRESGTTICSSSAPRDLQSANIASNQLNGESFDGTTDRPALFLDLSHNVLSGVIPHFITTLTNLQELTLSESKLKGPLPTEIGSHNQLSGEIPPIFMLSNLSTLRLNNNNLVGRLHQNLNIIFPRGLRSLELSHNQLSGPLPKFDACEHIETLHLDHNRFSGHLPTQDLKNLESLNLSHNQLSGPLPASMFGGMKRIAMLDLSSNQFSGLVPESLECHWELNLLDLSGNHLEGNLPDCFRTGSGKKSMIPLRWERRW
ncbi:hypothetical protein CcCBS67573_g10602 [Chytriomyces confervae]|uniref:F-box domain-containing protein n=1 Tax=Chytriomyces confervae TaxID=246404 RepID=A0A507CNY7_9FUNG|nr:hypothetical protein CcCBS67573_g10602 [Chytriomyces confervae]